MCSYIICQYAYVLCVYMYVCVSVLSVFVLLSYTNDNRWCPTFPHEVYSRSLFLSTHTVPSFSLVPAEPQCLNLCIMDMLGQIILCYGGQSRALSGG